MSENRRSNYSESENTCVVCFRITDAFSVGVCDHPVCFECSTRMRVLCNQNECPICRREMLLVIFTKEVEPFSILKPKVETLKLQTEKYGIHFATSSLQRRYYHLLDHECSICKRNANNNNPFKTFQQLKDHMRRAHDLFYCELCVTNLKIFTFERKYYTRVELATHRRKGDADNTSHRGHPLCEFCNTRFMDNDELFRHLRRDHLFCHFCDADGKHQYYSDYNDLRRHYLDEHYLCEEGECVHERFTSVFRTDIDLKAHNASVHGRNLSKAANRQARTLELEFTLAPRPRPDGNSGRVSRNYSSRHAERHKENENFNFEVHADELGRSNGETHQNQLFSNPLSAENFPSLGGDTVNSLRTVSNVTITSKINPLSEENFPLLGGSFTKPALTIKTTSREHSLQCNPTNFPVLGESSSNNTVRLSINSNFHQERPTSTIKATNVSIHLNHNANSEISTHISRLPVNGQNISVGPKSTNKDFPTLGICNAKVMQPQWVQPKIKKHESKANKVASAPNLPPSSLTDFPTLGKNTTSDSKHVASSSLWVNLNSFNSNTSPKSNKSVSRSSKTIELAPYISNNNNTANLNDVKNKSKKKRLKENGTLSNDLANSLNKVDISKSSDSKKLNSTNSGALARKRSELIVEVGEPSVLIGHVSSDDSANTVQKKPPPGFKLKPPPGLNNFSLGNNELIFTGSGCNVSTQQFFPPANFKTRNHSLIDQFKNLLQSTESIQQFKTYSDMFRIGDIEANKYYEYCKKLMGNRFKELFPELLVLLPNIQRQQELFVLLKSGGEISNLEVCATCKQIVIGSELRNHLSNHELDNHFPVLNHVTVDGGVWNKK